MKKDEYLVVRADVLPEVFRKVIAVKKLLDSGEVYSVNSAVQQVKISRSAFYKYRDAVRPFDDTKGGSIYSLVLQIENFPGVFPATIEMISRSGARIVNLHQNSALKGLSTILVTIDDGSMKDSPAEIVTRLRRVHGIRNISILDK